jgi:hypothetical protein
MKKLIVVEAAPNGTRLRISEKILGNQIVPA